MNPLLIRRRGMMAGKALPYDAEVEYLESTGTQLLDTGISGGTSSAYIIDFQIVSYITYSQLIASSRPSVAPKIYESTIYGLGCEWNGGGSDNTVSLVGFSGIYNRHKAEYNNGQVLFDNVVKATPGDYGFGSSNLCVFGYYPEPNLKISAKLYSLKVWLDGSLVRDFIPVRVGTVGYMYDRVSGQLFGNAGTGDFVLGPDIQ